MPGPAALTLDDVRVRYGRFLAVDGVTLAVARGEIVAVLGPNGSGKSTTLAVAAGLIDPCTGTVRVGGRQRDEDPLGFARQVGLVPQEPALYDELSAEANLDFFARLYGLRRHDVRTRVSRALGSTRLADRRRDRVGSFSGGMKQRLNLACALLHDPPVLLLDEPTASLDPASRDALYGTLHDLRESGYAILLTTHHVDEAEHGCDRIVVLERGRMVATGRPADLVRNQPGSRAVLYAHLREPLPRFFLKSLRRRIGSGVEIEVTGRRLRLAAATQLELGRALAVVLSDGIVLETFRTPPSRLEHLLRGSSTRPQTDSASESIGLAPVPFPPPGMD